MDFFESQKNDQSHFMAQAVKRIITNPSRVAMLFVTTDKIKQIETAEIIVNG